jgi:hypothetical protein
MKHLLALSIFLSIAVNSFSQTKWPTLENGDFGWSEVVDVDSADAKTLYTRARMFLANIYKSAKDVTQMEDEPSKTIIIKAVLRNRVKAVLTGWTPYGYTSYTVQIQCKDGRYKFELKDFYHNGESNGVAHMSYTGGSLNQEKGQRFPLKQWGYIKDQAAEEVIVLKTAIKKFMASNNGANW